MEIKRTKLIEKYRAKFPTSEGLYQRAVGAFPAGVTHVSRYLKPFPIYVDRAQGSRKWDVDGNELIDYWMGHGALLLGHRRPKVIEAVAKQLERSTHPGACHELEVRWADLVIEMIPCAERVRFTISGTEATHMALRLARAFTGRDKALKFEGHFHGWHSGLAVCTDPPFTQQEPAGIPRSELDNLIIIPPNDIEQVDQALRSGDVACVILEPTGGSYGQMPLKPGFLAELRDVTSKHETLLIFDEVITGFRCAPGGAQEHFGVTPDLATLGKILAGGLPGAAVVGRAEIMGLLSNSSGDGRRISHAGTYNANPLSAAAGIATLELVKGGEPIRKANEAAEALRNGMADIVKRLGLDWLVFGDFSFFHMAAGAAGADSKRLWEYDLKKEKDKDMVHAFRCGMLLHGVDLPGPRGWVSSEHTAEDVDRTLDALEKTLQILY
ncbi:MAG: aspartate aminotransferase family protein [Planctomycetota bacterium]